MTSSAPGTTESIHLAVALDGAGWHPAAWRDAQVTPATLFTPDYWIEQARTAERGLLDFLTIEDSLSLQTAHPLTPDHRVDQVRGRLDAVQLAARVATETTTIGLVPTASVLETEPFHLATAIATLDFASTGRAGWRVQVSRLGEAGNFGRRTGAELTLENYGTPAGQTVISERFGEAGDAIEVVRRLWDSWEDDAVIRDVPTGRFLDRTKVHHVDFQGEHFSVSGPSITPRPPQGQPVVTALAHSSVPYRLAATGADIVFVTPQDRPNARAIVAEIRDIEAQVGRTLPPVQVFADLVVVIDDTVEKAEARLDHWNELAGAAEANDALVVTGNASSIADLLQDWHGAGLAGFRLRPASVHLDLPAITDLLVPELQRRGLFRTAYETDTLRGHLGLDRPANRYAA